LLELLKGGHSVDLLSVHKDGRRRADAFLLPCLGIRANGGGVPARIETGVEGVGLKPDFGREPLEVWPGVAAAVHPGLLVEEFVAVVPEAILLGRAFACFGRPGRFIAEERQVPRDESDLAIGDECFLQLAPWTQGETTTGWSLKVAPFLDHDRCRRASFGVTSGQIS
jgi:hypothetical protein